MASSRFVEVLNPESQAPSSPLDVRLEDIIAQSDLSNRARSTSGSSLGSSSSENLSKEEQSPQRQKSASSKRRSRIFSFTNRWSDIRLSRRDVFHTEYFIGLEALYTFDSYLSGSKQKTWLKGPLTDHKFHHTPWIQTTSASLWAANNSLEEASHKPTILRCRPRKRIHISIHRIRNRSGVAGRAHIRNFKFISQTNSSHRDIGIGVQVGMSPWRLQKVLRQK